jgi:hypothetical protein
LRVPWHQFSKAYEQYPRWHAASLWIDVISRVVDSCEPLLRTFLNRHLRGFPQSGSRPRQSQPLSLSVLEWVHADQFASAGRQFWLDALVFYGLRHVWCEGAWLYWEYCETAWATKRPKRVPDFDEWWHSALRRPLRSGLNCVTLARAVEQYLDWDSFKIWFRPLLFGGMHLRPSALGDLQRYCPGISRADLVQLNGTQARRSLWKRIEQAGNDRLLSRAKQDGWVDDLLRHARSHPWHARTRSYAAHESRERISTKSYPTLNEWKRLAALYTAPGANR